MHVKILLGLHNCIHMQGILVIKMVSEKKCLCGVAHLDWDGDITICRN
jgi:hypothetical protein